MNDNLKYRSFHFGNWILRNWRYVSFISSFSKFSYDLINAVVPKTNQTNKLCIYRNLVRFNAYQRFDFDKIILFMKRRGNFRIWSVWITESKNSRMYSSAHEIVFSCAPVENCRSTWLFFLVIYRFFLVVTFLVCSCVHLWVWISFFSRFCCCFFFLFICVSIRLDPKTSIYCWTVIKRLMPAQLV